MNNVSELNDVIVPGWSNKMLPTGSIMTGYSIYGSMHQTISGDGEGVEISPEDLRALVESGQALKYSSWSDKSTVYFEAVQGRA